MVRSGIEPPAFRFSEGLACPRGSTTGRRTGPSGALALLVIHDQPYVSTAVVSKALARSAGGNDRACGASQVGAALEPGEDQPRQTVMTRTPGRTAQAQAAITALALIAVAIAACSTSRPSSRTAIPPEFRAACGHPGAHVRVRKVPVTVRHADCNLTGVVITYRGYGGAAVPGDGTSVGTSSGFTLTVHPGTLDVTINATGPPSNS